MCCCTLWTHLRVRFAYSIPIIRGINRDFTQGTADVRASWIRVAFAMMVSALIQVILGGSATQSVVTLYIYRVGWSVPIRSRNPYKSRIKIQLLTLIGHFGPI